MVAVSPCEKRLTAFTCKESYQDLPNGAWNWPMPLYCGNGRRLCSTDPESGKTYYTNKVERVWQGGALNFEDALSGNSVTLQNSEVKELSEGEFMATLALNQPSRPTVEANSTNVDF